MYSAAITVTVLAAFASLSSALKYDPDQVLWNLNQNQSATSGLDYWGEWQNHTFNPSPENWRFPFYTLMLDRFVNGDPTNDDINGTAWEHDLTGTQLRHGGDIKGLQDTLDYLAGMGIKGIYLAGSPMINFPWGSDGFSPLDFTLLDPHFGSIDVWRECIAEMHSRGMYVVLDNTMATLGDLIGFEGYLNVSTPLSFTEHNAMYKTSRQYHDFEFSNEMLARCDYPRFYDDTGYEVHGNDTEYFVGCRDSDFDQYGDIAAFDIYPEWQRQISKFASVQDRLREWKPSVRQRIEHFSCIQIAMLDIDGFRMDKGQQITVDAQGEFADHIRQCAKSFGKNNFFIPGEIVSGNAFGADYLGRGKTPDMMVNDTAKAVLMTTNNSDPSGFIRDVGKNAFDAACFHYSTYRSLTRFLGMDGHLSAEADTPVDFVDAWNDFIKSNDLINANTGVFDPRHMYGAQNQDVFRWPTIVNGTYKQNLGTFIITMLMPGIPMLEWGEEQAYYVLDNTADNYVFGRQPMSTATAWQDHGCYTAGNAKFSTWPQESAGFGCMDDWNSIDHRDPSHPIRNIMRNMFEMRTRYPVLNDGFYVKTLSKQTHPIYLPGSMGIATETGMWSVLRSRWEGVQDLSGQGQGNQSIWLLYHNEGFVQTYNFDCADNSSALIAPFDEGTTVKNLLYPYDELTLGTSPQILKLENSTKHNGCLNSLTFSPWGYMAYVPIEKWLKPSPVITKFEPGHDARIMSNSSPGESGTVPIAFYFSDEMNCKQVQNAISLNSATVDGTTPSIDNSSVACQTTNDTTANVSKYTGPITGQVPGAWVLHATLVNVSDGVHSVTIGNVSTQDGNASTNAVNHFMFRVGQADNPMVFLRTGNYSDTLLNQNHDGSLYISHKASGADKFRYSTNWGSSWTDWQPYSGGNMTVVPQDWSGTKEQRWTGHHVMVQYWSRLTGSSNYLQQGDLEAGINPRRYPHFFVHGSFNEYGYDSGLPSTMEQNNSGIWEYDFMNEWPSEFQINVWGVANDGKPDLTRAFGDVDNDGVLDLLSPVSLLTNVVKILNTSYPPADSLAYRIVVNDADLRYYLTPVGSSWKQALIYALLAAVPILTSVAATWAYLRTFYSVKFNDVGIAEKGGILPTAMRTDFHLDRMIPAPALGALKKFRRNPVQEEAGENSGTRSNALAVSQRRTVLIATMEYYIEDWDIKIKIGGLGVMAQLMSQNLQHQDLVWVVPCVGGIEYPADQRAKPMIVTILGVEYNVQVQYHHVRNITYVLLDAPVFRQNSKAEPYPRRMDDIDSAIFYSAWNSCIAETIRRFPVDLYHINDYHGAVAPLHLLPRVIPCCLSLHNAEFQGLWPMRTPVEMDEVCRIYNLEPEIVKQYVQFGEVFNLLHAGASYLRVWQKGFGAAGVSSKYGKRSFARYPIFWGLSKIGSLPNPDPTDTDDWDKQLPNIKDINVDEDFEARRGDLRRQAQEWAGLNVNPTAELFVFVGRWSEQKGIDLIADVFPAILESHSNAQLICVGPVIDLHGRFAALKLDKMMEIYPGRVFSKPEFTALPPYIFSGGEFVLIPSRDEPFGLVAVEFGRKGALGVGARVGGLGNMPGWWYTIESTSIKHLISQFKMAIEAALASKTKVRATMRARSAKQRFPVAQWKEDLAILQDTAIKLNQKQTMKHAFKTPRASGTSTPVAGMPSPPRFWNGRWSVPTTAPTSRPQSGLSTRAPSPSGTPGPLSLGRMTGPGHDLERAGRKRKRLSKANPSRDASVDSQAPESYRRGRRSSRNRPRISNPVPTSAIGTVIGSPTVPPLPGQPRGNRVSRISEAADEDVHGNTINPEGRVEYDSMAEEAAENTAEEDNGDEDVADEYILSPEQAEASKKKARLATLRLALESRAEASETNSALPPFAPSRLSMRQTPIGSPMAGDMLLSSHRNGSDSPLSRRSSFDDSIEGRPHPPPVPAQPPNNGLTLGNPAGQPSDTTLSLGTVLQGKKDYKLQSVDPFFTDPTGLYYHAFEQKLGKLNGKTSEGPLCVEEYLVKSEKDWFNRFRNVKMGKSAASTPASSIFRMGRDSPAGSIVTESQGSDGGSDNGADQFLLQENYRPPTGLKKFLLRRIGDWPLYSMLLAFGQIIAANSYQITLLTGEVGQSAEKLYIIASIYLVASICWWLLFRTFKSLYVLSTPFVFYGFAFFFLGLAPYAKTTFGRGWVQNVATAFYAAASSSGAFYFSLNFGSEGSVPVVTWSFRACVIQGTQQIYIVALWFWGSRLIAQEINGVVASNLVAYGPGLTGITIPIALIMWAIGAILFFGLPDYYRQAPGQVPSFYRSVVRRKIIMWFFITVLIQNFFLSAPYGRTWKYLWSSQHAPIWSVALLCLAFFILVWATILWAFGNLSKRHSWILPMFAVGLGAPRWCQMLWGTSGMGLWVPWAGNPVAGALLGRTLWLWLGVLDAVQGVGFGMILLQTLTRFHIVFTLVCAQVLGSVATIVARACAPDAEGPGAVFPNLALSSKGLGNAWFWIALACQLSICVGFFKFFRKEQLQKP